MIFHNRNLTTDGDSIMKTVSAVAIAIVAAFQSAILAQEPSAMRGMDQQNHHELMPTHAKIMEKEKAQDAEIDKLLAEMNSAAGEKRIDAIVAVLNKLIEQRSIDR
jgi:hypothetical protein